MSFLRAVARPMLAATFVVDGARSLRDPESLAVQAKPVTDRVVPVLQRSAPGLPVPTNPATWVRINGAVNIAAAGMLATGRLPRVAAVVLAASLGPTTLAGHAFWREPDPQVRAAQRVQFVKNVSMAGGLLMTAAAGRGRRASRSDAD
jgi:putative oxidoreductase